MVEGKRKGGLLGKKGEKPVGEIKTVRREP